MPYVFGGVRFIFVAHASRGLFAAVLFVAFVKDPDRVVSGVAAPVASPVRALRVRALLLRDLSGGLGAGFWRLAASYQMRFQAR